MDDYIVDHEMPLHLMQRKSQWKISKSSKQSTKIPILNTLARITLPRDYLPVSICQCTVFLHNSHRK